MQRYLYVDEAHLNFINNLCYVTLRYVMLCYVVLLYVIFHKATLCYVTCFCILALVNRHARHIFLRSILLYCQSVARLAEPYCSTLYHKRQDIRKKNLLNIMCVFPFFLQLQPEPFLILRRIQLDNIINIHWFLCKFYVILVRF